MLISMTIIIFILVLIAAVFLKGYKEYRKNFNTRGAESIGFMPVFLRRYPELEHRDFETESSDGPLLRGVILYPEEEPRGLIVMTHGYSLTAEYYLEICKRFTDSGFLVLAFDGLGCGSSEGASLKGLPQHIIDMKTVLDKVSEDEELSGYPLFLFGHSWGGYAACGVSCLGSYPIRGIATASAFRSSVSSMIPIIRHRYKRLGAFLTKIVGIFDRMTFGETASIDMTEGLRAASCPALIVHSDDDSVISFEESFVKVRDELKDLTDIRFVPVTGRNHDLFIPVEEDRRIREIYHLLSKEKEEENRNKLLGELYSLLFVIDDDCAALYTDFFINCIR